jgi:hypothetical protein
MTLGATAQDADLLHCQPNANLMAVSFPLPQSQIQPQGPATFKEEDLPTFEEAQEEGALSEEEYGDFKQLFLGRAVPPQGSGNNLPEGFTSWPRFYLWCCLPNFK